MFEAVSSRNVMVGRTAELSDLRAGIASALAGRPQVFFLTGEPGIGKTRLAAEAGGDARARGMRVIWSTCGGGVGAPPYWPFVQICRDLIELVEPKALGATLCASIVAFAQNGHAYSDQALQANGSVGGRFRLFDAISRLFIKASRHQPLIVTLDDFHEADEASWMLLRFLAKELSQGRIMIVVSSRIQRGSFAPPGIGGDLLRTGRQIELSGLTEDEVSEVAANYSGRRMTRRFVAKLHRVTAGNPFFVTEVVRSMLTRGEFDSREVRTPDSVRVSIRERLEKLPAPVVSTLSMAAVLGTQFDLNLLKHTLDRPLDAVRQALDEAGRQGIVVPVEGSTTKLAFSHALLREVLYNDLRFASRASLHRRVANALETLYRTEPEPHLDQLAYHFGRAANSRSVDAKAIGYACNAAEAAKNVHAYERAASHWQSALELMERTGWERRGIAEILLKLGDAYSITEFEQPKGIRCLERAASIFKQLEDSIESAHVRARLGMILSRRGPTMNIPRAMDAYREAEQILGNMPPSESLALLYVGFAQAAGHAENTIEGHAASQKAMEIARRLGNDSIWLIAAAQHSDFLFSLGKIAESTKLSDRAWRIADRMNDLKGAFETAWSGGYHPLGLWDPREARRWFARELSRPRQAEAALQRAIFIQQTAFADIMLGDLETARGLLVEAPRDVVEGLMHFYAGDWRAADRILDEADDLMQSMGSRDGETVACFFRGQVRLAMGDLEQAESLNGRVLRNSIEGPILPYELNSRAQAALIAVRRNDLSGAREHVDRCRQIIAGGEDFRGLVGRAALAEAALAGSSGDLQRASTKFTQAINTFRRLGLVWEEAEAHITWANDLLRGREEERANEHFGRAQRIYERHGAGKAWINRIESARPLARSARPQPEWDRVPPPSLSESRLPEEIVNTILLEGDYFTLIYCGRTLRLRSSKGLHYLSQLLARPFSGFAPELLTRAQSNARATMRRVAGTTPQSRERARVAVTKAIKSTINKIRRSDPALGRLLGVAIRTGYVCEYQPDTDIQARWKVEGIRLAPRENEHTRAAS